MGERKTEEVWGEAVQFNLINCYKAKLRDSQSSHFFSLVLVVAAGRGVKTTEQSIYIIYTVHT